MEKATKLADLKLVNKYYPPVSNYSYPRPEGGPHQVPVGRSSVGSDCSAPGMTDDQESDISAEDANQYHVAGDELWDSFWEDSGEPVCDAQLEEEQGPGPEVSRDGARYPALIPSPVAQRKAAAGLVPWEDHHRRVGAPVPPRVRNQEAVDQNAGVSSCWPLVTAERPITPMSKTAKATCSYSLFPPQPKPTPILNLAPRRPPRSGCLWETLPHCPSTLISHPPSSSLGRPTKPRKLHLPTSDGAISYNSYSNPSRNSNSNGSASFTHSAPVSPTVSSHLPLSAAATISRRSEPNSLVPPRQMNLTRICSDTTVLYSMDTNTASQETLTAPTIPQRSPQRRQGRHSRQQSQLRNSITAAELSSTPTSPQTLHTPAVRTSQASSDITQWPTTTPPPPPPPPRPATPPQQHRHQQEDLPVPVSVFELDSDSEDEDVNFARRIVRNLTPHKRTRSAAAAPRTRKGGDLAKEQLRRARAGTLSPTTTTAPSAAVVAGGTEEKDAALLGMRRQRNEVFGRLFGARW
ncbi:hypothetical protein VP1G_03454 [Cytospora mali]|uniref:Uncharacterized protein n=1 Tax=Cytospora mali TaxID=578113 RepID=A0A194UWU3_CYTMA|nr:hypothetical protein VP1G_03454 [Valsa mali var. pyri (nom. inval.)]